MHIGILSFQPPRKKPTRQETRLVEEAGRRGHKATIFRVQRCVMLVDGNGKLEIRYANKALPKFDVIIPRVGVSENVHIRCAIVEHFQLMGVPVINNYSAILRAKSKLHTMQILSSYKIPVVKTAIVHDEIYLDDAFKYLGSFPTVLKTVFGFGGNGVALIESKRAAKSVYGLIDAKYSPKNGILLQEYIEESKGKDIRLFVVGRKVIAAMERTASLEDFRSNVKQGGHGKAYTPTRQEINLAVRAAKAIGLDIAGVDIIQTKHGPAIMEVNANPGFEELEKVTGINIGERIIKFARKYVNEFVPPHYL